MDALTLRQGPAGCVVAPEGGGAVARYWTETAGGPVEWLRPAAAEALARREASGMASFPLVPYSNRVRAGRFVFRDRTVALPLNHPPLPHSLHGHGWQAPWRVTAADPAAVELEYRHPAGAWPWAYTARQRVRLAPDRLTLELELANDGDEPMPAGLGVHPYFPRTPGATLTAAVRRVWLTDGEVMPTALAAPPATWDPTAGLRVDAAALDHCFTGWDRRAVVAWPERAARLVVTAGAPLDFLVVYTPPGQGFFCAEPVSHCTDAFNLAATGRTDTGTHVLAPGQTLRASVTLAPDPARA